MFNLYPTYLQDRWGKNDDDFSKIVVNLNPIEYSSDFSDKYFLKSTLKHNNGSYDEQSGNITINDIYTAYHYNAFDIKGTGQTKTILTEKITTVSPLTPIIIVPDKDKIPLIEAALGEFNFGNKYYIVPAIFLKYNADKIRNDYIEKGVITTLDVASIVASGGSALATKVHWVRRAWALAEVVGATGNIAINHTKVSANTKQIVDGYNLAMASVGVKNITKKSYKLVKKLSNKNIALKLVKSANEKPVLEIYELARVSGKTKNISNQLTVFLEDTFTLAKRKEVIEEDLLSKFPNLTIDELTAIKVYTSNEMRNGKHIYEILNMELRKGTLNEYNKGLNELLNNALSKLPSHKENVFIGVYGEEASLAKTWKVGDEITFKDFKSSSTDKQIAVYDFADKYGSNVFYEIVKPKGNNVCRISCLPNEMEILLKSN